MKKRLVILVLFLSAILPLTSKSTFIPLTKNQASLPSSDTLKNYISFENQPLALINATVIDGTGNKVKPSQTLLIEKGIFTFIGNSDGHEIPQGFRILDLEGKTLIPGIVGVHNHLHIPGFRFIGEVARKLYLASGVTTIQTCGAAAPYEELALAKQIERSEKIGPDIVTSGPYFTGPGGNPNMIIPRDEIHIRDTLQHWIQQGVTWFKIYRHTRPQDLKIILDEAHKHKAKVTGHLCAITFEEATKMGIDGIEHGLNSASDFRTNKTYGACNGGRDYMDELDISGEEVKALQQLMIDHQVFLTSTLSIYESSVPSRAFADLRTLQALSPELKNQYYERRQEFDKAAIDSTREKRLQRIMAFDYQFFQMGGLLGSGADAGRHVLPGFGDQRNFELFIEAGFTTEEAVQIMTSNGAKILERNNIGSIEVGKRADFLILHGNLIEDPTVIRQVDYTFKNGIGYHSRKILEETHGQVGRE